VVVTVLVVVTHFAWLLGASKLCWFDGLFRDLQVLLVAGTRNRSVNGELVDVSGLLVLRRAGSSAFDSEVVGLGSLLERGVLRAGWFNGEVVDLGLLSVLVLRGSGASFNGVVVDLEGVLGLVLRAGRGVGSEVGLAGTETLAVLALSDVNGGGVVGMTGVDLYLGVRSGVLRSRFRSTTILTDVLLSLIMLVLVLVLLLLVLLLLLLDTGTAVLFFFARDSDLFLAVVVLFARRNDDFSGGGGVRRVLTFPSGFWL
jgi:hypothetical protein